MNHAEQLARGIAALGVDLPAAGPQRLLAYVALLAKWNRVFNLTAVRDEAQMISHHVLDSLSVLPHVAADNLADIGSGGGLPGIPLAIARPHMRVTLVETSGKKASFLQQATTELDLANVTVINARVETWQPDVLQDAVIARALSELAAFVRLTDHLVRPAGCWYAMKGINPLDELAQLPSTHRVERTIALEVAQLDAQRHLIVITRN